MKHLLLSLILLAFCSAVFAQDQPMYRMHFTKFKHNMVDKGIEIGMKYFQAAYDNLGRDCKVYRLHTGPWHVQVLIQTDRDQSLAESLGGDSEIWQEMIRLAGSEEKIVEIVGQFNDAVLEEEHFIVTQIGGN